MLSINAVFAQSCYKPADKTQRVVPGCTFFNKPGYSRVHMGRLIWLLFFSFLFFSRNGTKKLSCVGKHLALYKLVRNWLFVILQWWCTIVPIWKVNQSVTALQDPNQDTWIFLKINLLRFLAVFFCSTEKMHLTSCVMTTNWKKKLKKIPIQPNRLRMGPMNSSSSLENLLVILDSTQKARLYSFYIKRIFNYFKDTKKNLFRLYSIVRKKL